MVDVCWVWAHIRKMENESGEVLSFKCKTCKKVFSKETSTTSLDYHLSHVHGLSPASNNDPNFRQLKLEECKEPVLTKDQITMTNRRLAILIASNNLPFSFLDSIDFKRFCEQLNSGYSLPAVKTMRNLIESIGTEMREVSVHELRPLDFVSISCDLWTNSSYLPFIGIKVHFCKDFALKERTLCCKSIPFPHTAENIADAIKSEMIKYGIENKTKFIVTDNAANMKKACELLSIPRIPCIVHTIQLILKDSLEDSMPLMKKARKLTKMFHTSPKLRQKLSDYRHLLKREQEIEVIMDIKTRWNSSLAMLERLLLLHDDIKSLRNELKKSDEKNDVLQGNDLEESLLSDEEIKDACEIVKILTPFKLACDLLELSKIPTLSRALPIIAELKSMMSNDNSHNFNSIRKKALKAIMERYEDLPMEMLLPSYLDLQFKNFLFPGSQHEIEKSEMLRSIKMLIGPEEENVIEQKNSKSKLSLFFKDKVVVETEMKGEIEKYEKEDTKGLDENFNALDWWMNHKQDYPRLSKLACNYLSIPASSAPVERLFSLAGNLVTMRRNQLDPEIIDSLMIIKDNNQNNHY